MATKRTQHAVYEITYHFVWCPKYRRPVLVGDIAKRLDALLVEKIGEIDGEMIALEIMPDHVQDITDQAQIGLVSNVLHGYLVVLFFENQLNQRVIQKLAGALNAPVYFSTSHFGHSVSIEYPRRVLPH